MRHLLVIFCETFLKNISWDTSIEYFVRQFSKIFCLALLDISWENILWDTSLSQEYFVRDWFPNYTEWVFQYSLHCHHWQWCHCNTGETQTYYILLCKHPAQPREGFTLGVSVLHDPTGSHVDTMLWCREWGNPSALSHNQSASHWTKHWCTAGPLIHCSKY